MSFPAFPHHGAVPQIQRAVLVADWKLSVATRRKDLNLPFSNTYLETDGRGGRWRRIP
jgi:hypothetical protein